ncbi:uncharacterized protein PV07_11554 [Cladophialophora immunda]|uniref:Uncharacterized protein n=1 Tax=Cladophialophora immunda TaxID=569365 RepID=A0A0D1Z6U5_9EURO|nr:uncharacterized protein PV07_11554 [Cladophialophora immunda]KIW23346.1 hypothetical protein PV07_11554 [Cladophialophora immunda]OQV07029.1 hypothetical protein CLAIMM_11522 [Cladophialophora immunda]
MPFLNLAPVERPAPQTQLSATATGVSSPPDHVDRSDKPVLPEPSTMPTTKGSSPDKTASECKFLKLTPELNRPFIPTEAQSSSPRTSTSTSTSTSTGAGAGASASAEQGCHGDKAVVQAQEKE